MMARKTRKYSKKASSSVERVMKKRKAGTLKSGRSGRKVKSRKQAIAIGLSEAGPRGRRSRRRAPSGDGRPRRPSAKPAGKHPFWYGAYWSFHPKEGGITMSP